MVNYCCVYGCGRNSRLNRHLNYYSLPKEKNRQIQWLKVAGREDLLFKNHGDKPLRYRFCSRHFEPSNIKNRHLTADAMPSLCLPGIWNEVYSEDEPEPHTNVVCNNCESSIQGFRYKCVTCKNYDLCQKCEMHEAHANHYMLRIPKPLKFKLADNLIKKWRRFFQAEHVLPDSKNNDSSSSESVRSDKSGSDSDDEPITKYINTNDSGVELDEEVKSKIRKEVIRALEVAGSSNNKQKRKINKKRPAEDETTKKQYKVDESDKDTMDKNVPEVVFADVNQFEDKALDMNVKVELPGDTSSIVVAESPALEEQATAQMKVMNDDLTVLMMEVSKHAPLTQ